MQVEFQGKSFTAHPVDGGGHKVMYLNTTRNIAGSVTATDPSTLPTLLQTQSVCCRWDDGVDALEPRS